MPSGVPSGANDFIESTLSKQARDIEDTLDMDIVTFVGAMMYGVDDLMRDAIEGRSKKRESLAVVVETTGGYIEPVRRMVNVFRQNYPAGRVEFIVPSYALSAGTILAMSGDAIHMDYYSTLGPIDPQAENEQGDLVPALGYLVQYERLLKKANDGEASSAEVALLMRFDQAELYKYEQDRELSVMLLKEWLVKYKFKGWNATETSGTAVTPEMREARAEEVARTLNDTERWHSHGHGITMEVLRREVKLVIDDFGENDKLNSQIRSYHRLLIDYMRRLNRQICVHRPEHIYY